MYKTKNSDAFEKVPDLPDIKPALECTAKVLNVNFGHNKELMDKCIRLYHYSLFIAKINEYIDQGLTLVHAIDNAIDYALKNDILVDILTVNRGEVNKMLLTEFDEKKFARTMKSEGREEGISIGQDNIFKIMAAIYNGNDTVEKLVSLGFDPELSEKFLSELNKLK